MSSDTAARITTDLTAAMKSREPLRMSVLRGLKAAIQYWQIDVGHPVDEYECEKLLRSEQKKRRDAIALYRQGGRDDLARKEEAELTIIGEYLPKEMADTAIAGIVDSIIAEMDVSGMGDLGRVMKVAMPKMAGRADGNRVRQVVSERLQRLTTIEE